MVPPTCGASGRTTTNSAAAQCQLTSVPAHSGRPQHPLPSSRAGPAHLRHRRAIRHPPHGGNRATSPGVLCAGGAGECCDLALLVSTADRHRAGLRGWQRMRMAGKVRAAAGSTASATGRC